MWFCRIVWNGILTYVDCLSGNNDTDPSFRLPKRNRSAPLWDRHSREGGNPSSPGMNPRFRGDDGREVNSYTQAEI